MKAYYHLPGLFEFYGLYSVFLPLYREHPECFYDWCGIGSVYGAPEDCIWGGGRTGGGEEPAENVASLMKEYGISARLTFSNSLLTRDDLSDRRCNRLLDTFRSRDNGIIICSDLLLEYIKENYPEFYFVSSTTKVLTDFEDFRRELDRSEYRFAVPDFRLNREFGLLESLTGEQKGKVEFLCNECCSFDCPDRKRCYENVSRKCRGEECEDHICVSSEGSRGYRFSAAMENPGFIGTGDILNRYMPAGFSHFKIEGRGLGSAVVLEFLLYYMTRPEYQLKVREEIYLDSMLDLF